MIAASALQRRKRARRTAEVANVVNLPVRLAPPTPKPGLTLRARALLFPATVALMLWLFFGVGVALVLVGLKWAGVR